MLSQNTLRLLKIVLDESNSAYEFGGIDFFYSLSTCYPVKLNNRERINKLRAEKNIELYTDEVELLSEFIDLATNPGGSAKISSTTSELVDKFLESLSSDFPNEPKCLRDTAFL